MKEDYDFIKDCECKSEPENYCKIKKYLCEVEKSFKPLVEGSKFIAETFGREYRNEFDDIKTGLQSGMDKAKQSIMREIIHREVKNLNPNIKIGADDETELLKDITGSMKISTLLSRTSKKYGAHEEITFDQILDMAKKLRPYSGNISIEKNRLILKHSVSVGKDSYNKGEPSNYASEEIQHLEALGKLTDIIINKTKPSQATSYVSSKWDWRDKSSFWDEKDIPDDNLKSAKFFKNGTLQVKFDTPENAEKMRKVLQLL